MSETFVKSFTHLKDRPKSDRALPMLQRIASLVKPIMRKHSWVLPVLAEFFPESPNLVGKSLQPSSISKVSFLTFIDQGSVRFQGNFTCDSAYLNWVSDMNMGQKILLRLRPAHAPDTFYDEEEVVQTMLHEASRELYLSAWINLLTLHYPPIYSS